MNNAMIDFEEIRENLLKNLKTLNKDVLSGFSVVSMFDFIVDHTLFISNIEDFFTGVKKIMKQGGGELPLSRQILHRGGCGANVSSGLSRIGLSTCFIGRTNSLGKELLNYFLDNCSINLDHVKVDGNLGLTTIFEIGDEKVNVMIGDMESYSTLCFNDLTDSDLELISKCSLLGIFNWTLNKSGTELAAKVLPFAKKTNVLTYLDTGDPRFRIKEAKDLFENVISNTYLDVFSVNENELNCYYDFIKNSSGNESYLNRAFSLRKNISANLDFHTSRYSASFTKNAINFAPVFNIKPLRKTGAGDSWNAGNVLGYVIKLRPEERLLLANGLACYYISSPSTIHPNLNQITEFLKNTPLAKLELDYA